MILHTRLSAYMNKNIFATGDAMSEYKATKRPTTIFIGLDFENRKSRIFPEDVPIVTSYNSLLTEIIILEKIKQKHLNMSNIIQKTR